jgi:hypothetical protein
VKWGIEHRRSDIYFESRGKTIKFCRNEIDILEFGNSELESNLVGVNTLLLWLSAQIYPYFCCT